MSNFDAKSICILGRQPALGLAELESLYGAEHVRPLGGSSALLDVDASSINFRRLGGTIKVARLLSILPDNSWHGAEKYLIDNIPAHLEHLPEGKFTLGVSAYELKVTPAEINKSTLSLKKLIKKTGRPVRVVPNKQPALNSAQVLHNRLINRGGWELLLIGNKGQTYLAQTLFVQDIEAYGARDQARPKRDAKVGMLPPKLAQILINLANPPAGGVVLDPFCGTGVVLQEALLMSYKAIGSDYESKMIEYTKTNLDWLSTNYPEIKGKYELELGDATNHKWTKDINAVVSEVYLGRPLNALPAPEKMREIVKDVNTILEKFLKNLSSQLAKETRVSLAIPAWRDTGGQLVHLPLIDQISGLGYTKRSFVHVKNSDLVYFRENQIVARELIILMKV